MDKIKLIIAREYLIRVKKKSFIILTILGPILFAALLIVPTLVSNKSQKKMNIVVVDDNDFFINKFKDTEKTRFTYRSGDIESIKKEALTSDYDAVLHILYGSQAMNANLFFVDPPAINSVTYVESQMNKLLFDKILIDSFSIESKKFDQIKQLTRATVTGVRIDKNGNESETSAIIGKVTGGVCGMLIYSFIFLFSGQVLRSVLEEKTNRIVEVLVSSVKPMQLMMGKVIGVALVGLTQFLIWIVFTFLIVIGIQLFSPTFFHSDSFTIENAVFQDDNMISNAENNDQWISQGSIFHQIDNYFNISFTTLILCFIFYFLMGYLIYAALYAAVGSAVDNETDSQQFTMPITIPILLTLVLLFPMADNPNGSLAVWMSIIPLTSPVAMMIRLPNGVPPFELALSMILTVVFFVFVVWMAAKIYRVGILMYGKRITYRDLLKWLKNKK